MKRGFLKGLPAGKFAPNNSTCSYFFGKGPHPEVFWDDPYKVGPYDPVIHGVIT